MVYVRWVLGLFIVALLVSLIFPGIDIIKPPPILPVVMGGIVLLKEIKGLVADKQSRYPPLSGEFGHRERFLGDIKLSYDLEGIERLHASGVRTFYPWSAITDIEETEEILILIIDKRSGIVISKSVFSEESKYRKFLHYIASRAEHPHDPNQS